MTFVVLVGVLLGFMIGVTAAVLCVAVSAHRGGGGDA
jgi:hypothetical protein